MVVNPYTLRLIFHPKSGLSVSILDVYFPDAILEINCCENKSVILIYFKLFYCH